MEELLGLLIGAGAVALAPLVPALRPVAKMAVKGGLIAVEATAMAAPWWVSACTKQPNGEATPRGPRPMQWRPCRSSSRRTTPAGRSLRSLRTYRQSEPVNRPMQQEASAWKRYLR